VAQRIVEMIVGRLITDEGFRAEFLADPTTTLTALCDRGLDLTLTEVAALMSTDPSLWARAAGLLDSRLHKVSLVDLPDEKENTHHV
jgi:hypothetical protein